MKIQCFHSSSAGNLYSVSDGRTRIMLECGVDIKEIQKCFDFGLSRVAGCLISHEHGDHSKSWEKVAKYTPVYMLKETAEALGAKGYNIKHCTPLTLFTVGSFVILPFGTEHDVPSCGYYIRSTETGESLIFVIDTPYSRYAVRDVNYAMIECNYQLEKINEAVDRGYLVPAMRNRIVNAHMSLETAISTLKRIDSDKLKEVHILHLSSRHTDEKHIKKTIEQTIGKPVYIAGK